MCTAKYTEGYLLLYWLHWRCPVFKQLGGKDPIGGGRDKNKMDMHRTMKLNKQKRDTGNSASEIVDIFIFFLILCPNKQSRRVLMVML